MLKVRNHRHSSKTALSLRNFFRDSSGGARILFVLALPVLIGIGALTHDTGLWYANQRTAQAVANSAAIAAALETAREHDEATAIQAALEDAEENGFNTAHGVLSLNIPASTGPFKDQDGTVEAVVEMNVQGLLSAFYRDETTVVARAVARTMSGERCVWVMDGSAKSALVCSGMTNVVWDPNKKRGSTVTVSIATTVAPMAAGFLPFEAYTVDGTSSLIIAQ